MAQGWAILLMFCAAFPITRAATDASTQLLRDAVEHWLGERNEWAFTQRAVEYENGAPAERLERYDPSRPGNAQWRLLAINGVPPTPEQQRKWADRKFKRRHRRFDTPVGDFFDFGAAKIVAETLEVARFEVPLRKDKNWLFPVDKVDVWVTINKQTRALERLSAEVREPFKVLLGIARIDRGEIDLDFFPLGNSAATPATAQPAGVAKASVLRFGGRVDFTWSDFQRVTPATSIRVGDPAGAEAVLDWLQ